MESGKKFKTTPHSGHRNSIGLELYLESWRIKRVCNGIIACVEFQKLKSPSVWVWVRVIAIDFLFFALVLKLSSTIFKMKKSLQQQKDLVYMKFRFRNIAMIIGCIVSINTAFATNGDNLIGYGAISQKLP